MVGGWAVNLAYDPVAQQGTLLLHNLVCVCVCDVSLRVCVCVSVLVVCSGEAPIPAALHFNVCFFFFLIPCCSKLVVFKQLLESSRLSCCV